MVDVPYHKKISPIIGFFRGFIDTPPGCWVHQIFKLGGKILSEITNMLSTKDPRMEGGAYKNELIPPPSGDEK
ncbi:hypothetical protein FGU46_03220 [Methanobacterium sp. CWC-01]|uniref:hypothetical protein n=1 Tax=Methanobacterium aridiramus TaxID=2584467 RepID=UPI0025783ED3|nr:hypothetical protein [Methanobacterium sp. CWC-01]WJI09170.1 hypothetical protein FGU46_03220 [Methanobacterium sp. CWC-01]